MMELSIHTTNKSTTLSSSQPHPSISPHGILKLPQSVASTLAADFLKKREIRDLGVTCRWMLVSLRDCSINEPISLPFAVDRLNRQQSSAGSKSHSERSESLVSEQIHAVRIPNVYVGRFRNIDYSLHKEQVTESAVRLLSDLRRLVDCRKFNLWISDLDEVPKKFDLDLPFVLPARLLVFHVENIGNLISIGDFVLPSSLTKLEFEPYQNYPFACVSKVKWPTEPSKLTELHGLVIDSPLNTSLILPDGLQCVSFWDDYPSFKKHFPIPIAFPNTITDLNLPVWQDQDGRYRDLQFPPFLKRLVFIGEMGKEDFDLTQWRHLPISCTNLELKLRSESEDIFEFNHTQTQPSSPIIIPFFVVQLRIRRLIGEKEWGLAQWRYTKWQLPQLQLSHATSLTSLATDTLQAIQWPEGSSFVLTALKPIKISGQEFFAAIFPTLTSLQLIDLTATDPILKIESDVADSSDYQRLYTLFPNLNHLVVPLNYKIELIDENDPTRPMMPAFREVVTELFYKYASADNPTVTTEPKKTMSKNDFTRYVLMCGVGLSSAADERLTMIFTKFALPQGWSNSNELTVDGFCEFYRDACSDRMGNVWSDLRVHGSHRRLIGDEFFGPIASLSRALSNCLVECRMSVTYPSEYEPILGLDDKLECFQYVNGVEVSRSVMGQLYLPEEINEERFDLKPTVTRNHHH